MAIISNLDFNGFRKEFNDYGRGDQFSLYGLKKLFDFLENFSEDTGEQIDLDVIALCCEYSEYNDVHEFLNDYNIDVDTSDLDDDEILYEIRDYLNYNTMIVNCEDDCILFAAF